MVVHSRIIPSDRPYPEPTGLGLQLDGAEAVPLAGGLIGDQVLRPHVFFDGLEGLVEGLGAGDFEEEAARN